MKIGIVGYGWLAERIGEAFKVKHSIMGTTRSKEKAEKLTKKGIKAILWGNELSELKTCDALLMSLPVSKQNFDRETVEYLLTFIRGYDKPIIVFSSTGIYPQNTQTFTEKHTENLNPFILAYEDFFRFHFPQSVILRFGGLMGDERRFARFFENRPLTKPFERVNHVHYKDIIKIIQLIFDKQEKSIVYNIVAPNHPTKQEVLAKQTDKEFPLTEEIDLKSRIISSDKFIKNYHYTFLFPDPTLF